MGVDPARRGTPRERPLEAPHLHQRRGDDERVLQRFDHAVVARELAPEDDPRPRDGPEGPQQREHRRRERNGVHEAQALLHAEERVERADLQQHHDGPDRQQAAEEGAQVVASTHVHELVDQHRAQLVRPEGTHEGRREEDGRPEASGGERQRGLVGVPVQRGQALQPDPRSGLAVERVQPGELVPAVDRGPSAQTPVGDAVGPDPRDRSGRRGAA